MIDTDVLQRCLIADIQAELPPNHVVDIQSSTPSKFIIRFFCEDGIGTQIFMWYYAASDVWHIFTTRLDSKAIRRSINDSQDVKPVVDYVVQRYLE